MVRGAARAVSYLHNFQASHSRAPLAVGVLFLEPVTLDRVSLSHHVPVS